MPVMAMPVGGALKVERKFTGQAAKRLLLSGARQTGAGWQAIDSLPASLFNTAQRIPIVL